MQHTRRVNWLWKQDKPKTFPLYTLKQGDTTQILDSQEVVDWINTLNLDFLSSVQLPILPQENEEEINQESIAEFLYNKGTSGNSIERLINVIDDLHMIAKWYKKQDSPSEFETESYLIIPLLRALGWTPQKMAIEWNKVNIALFQKLPRSDENLVAVVEAKRKGNSCLTAFSQAERYSQNKKNCNRLIVTDGLRYGIFLKNQDSFYKLHAYMNLTEFKNEYAVYECNGINEALWAMTLIGMMRLSFVSLKQLLESMLKVFTKAEPNFVFSRAYFQTEQILTGYCGYNWWCFASANQTIKCGGDT